MHPRGLAVLLLPAAAFAQQWVPVSTPAPLAVSNAVAFVAGS